MIHTGDVTLPDGRIVSGKATFHYEHDTDAYVLLEDSIELEWKDGDELTADEMNETVDVVRVSYEADPFLWEYVVDQLVEMPGEYEDG